MTALEFYGQTYSNASAARKVHLDRAKKFLDMALRAEADINAKVIPSDSRKLEMALNAACKAEAEAFAV